MPQGNGELIIGGQIFKIDAPVVNWHTSKWDATSPYCIPTKTDPAPKCLSAGGGGTARRPGGAWPRQLC